MKVFTAGYEGRSLESFLTDLRAHGVRLLADVREALGRTDYPHHCCGTCR